MPLSHAASARRPLTANVAAAGSFGAVLTFCPLLAGLPAPIMATVTGHARWRYFRRGETLIRCGQIPADVLVIAEGVLTAAIPGPARPEPTRILQRGQICGELALLGDAPPLAEVRALSNGAALVLDGRDVKAAIRDDRDFAARIIRHLCAQARSFELDVQVNHARDASARLAHVLLTLSALRNPPRTELTQGMLAELIGVRRETVGRTLKRWKREEMVAMTGRHIYPRDPTRLMQEAQARSPGAA